MAAIHQKLVTISDGGKLYTFDAEVLYEDYIRTHTWRNPVTQRELSREVINTVVGMCCPDIYVSYVSQTHLVSCSATLGRILVDFILETNAPIDKDVVHLDTFTNKTTSLFQHDLQKEVLAIDISHLMLVSGNFSSDISKIGAHRQLYNFLALLPALTIEESSLLQEVIGSIRPPQVVRNYEFKLPPQEIRVISRPVARQIYEEEENYVEVAPVPQPVRPPRPVLRQPNPNDDEISSPQPVRSPRPILRQPATQTALQPARAPQRSQPPSTVRTVAPRKAPAAYQEPIINRRVTTLPTVVNENITRQEVINQEIYEEDVYDEAPEEIFNEYSGTDVYQPPAPSTSIPLAEPRKRVNF